MSGVKHWLMTLQDRPEYSDGYAAAERRELRHCFILTGDAKEAWLLGYGACVDEHTPRPGEP